MIKVENKKTINKLAIRSFRASKNRNIIAIIAIVLTSVLFTSLFTVGIGIKEIILNQTLRQAGGDGHAVLKYITDDQYNKIKNHPLIKEISYNKVIADSVDNPEFLKRRAEMYYMDQIGMKLGFCQPTTGNLPKAENEIITDTKTLDLLGIPHEIGAVVPLTYTMRGEQKQTNFVLSGYWESDTVFNVGLILVSYAFTEANQKQLENTYQTGFNLTGVTNSYIMFHNTLDLEGNLRKVVTESGYTIASGKGNIQPTDIACNINWVYTSNGISSNDLPTMIAMLAVALLIVFTGYLIIYNIFQISVIQDIRFYGLLKTIGTTQKQMKKILAKQALILSSAGIPIGLVLGFFIGKALIPIIMSTTNLSAQKYGISLNPLIFAGAALFALITVFISIRKPSRVAAKVSPIEAFRFSGNSECVAAVNKRSTDGGKLWKMAFSNLGRNKKRTTLVVISMTLGLVLLNSVFTISRGFDMDKYISRFVDTDFLIGHANYFSVSNSFRSIHDQLSESFIEAVRAQDGFIDGGRIYYHLGPGYIESDENGGRIGLQLYGLEDMPLSRAEVVEGELNIEKLKNGRYIVECLKTDDRGNVYPESSRYQIGEKIKINVDGVAYEYELIAKVKEKFHARSVRYSIVGCSALYLSADQYQLIVNNPVVMTYAFNVEDDKEIDFEKFVKTYTEQSEPLMSYDSKQVYVDSYRGMQNMLFTIGGTLSLIIGLIGVLNFVNSILTSILIRRQEFAVLQSIGMTRRQLVQLLLYEGIYYALSTVGLSFILSVLFSLTVIGGMLNKLWLFSYKFVISPLLLTYPILIILAIIIPYISYRSVNKHSVVEMLREIG